jgi:hypothetical protein
MSIDTVGAPENAVTIATVDPSLVAILTMVMVGLVFPVVLHNFKKTERLIEETKSQVGQHATTLATHEIRIMTLEQWRNIYYPVTPPVPNMVPHDSAVN